MVRRNIEVVTRQDEIIQHTVSPERNVGAVQAATTPDITEEEITVLATWLSEVESAQIYERLENEDLHFTEVTSDNDVKEVIIGVNSRQLAESINAGNEPADIEQHIDTVEDELVVDIDESQPDTHDKDNEANNDTLVISNNIEDLINGIEDAFETAEQEIPGELLIYILTTDIDNALPKVETVLLFPKVEESAETIDTQLENPLDKFSSYLENYESDVRNQAVELISSISELVNELKSEDNLSQEDKEQFVIELEQTIHDLFATLGLELEDEQAHKFVELLLMTLDNEQFVTREYDIDYLNRMGTREYKPLNGSSILSGLVQTASKEIKQVELVGKYTIQMCVA